MECVVSLNRIELSALFENGIAVIIDYGWLAEADAVSFINVNNY